MIEIKVDPKVMKKRQEYKVQTLELSQGKASKINIILIAKVNLKNKKYLKCFNHKQSFRNLLNRIM